MARCCGRPSLAGGRRLVFGTGPQPPAARFGRPICLRPEVPDPMTDRQIPKPSEIFELMRFKKPELDAKKRRLDAALTIYDLRDIARRRTPRAAFDYTDGAAEG